MKKSIFIGALMLMGMMLIAAPVDAQTRKERKAAQKAEWEHQQKMKELQRQRELDSMQNAMARPAASPAGQTFDVPCMAAGRSDKEYYRQIGYGRDIDLSIAQQKALQNAKSRLRDRLGEQVKGLVSDYSKTVSKSNKGQDLEGILEREFTSVVDAVLNDADNPCEQPTQLNTGEIQYYYVVEIRKNELVDKMANVIDKNDQLKAEYDRDQFRKYAEEYMKKQQDFQNNQQ